MTALPPVLTVSDLVSRQLAREVTIVDFRRDGSRREDTRYEISARGQEMLRENQLERGRLLRDDPELRRAEMRAALIASRASE